VLPATGAETMDLLALLQTAVRPPTSRRTDAIKLLRSYLSMWFIGTVHAEHETVISRAWVQSPDPAK